MDAAKPSATVDHDPPAGNEERPAALADELLSTIGSIRRSGRLMGRPLAFSALTGAQLDLVRLVRRRAGISVAEAAAELRLAPNTVSTLVRQLTDSGLLIRQVDPEDRRVARLELSARTQREAGHFRDRRVALLALAIAELAPDELERLVDAADLLGRLAARLPQLVPPDA